MELEIQIVRDPCHELAKHRLRVFGPSGGNIGRSPDNYWSLPDPKCYVSGQHCEIEFRDGGFWLRDTSRNGVFVNDATERVGYGHRVRLDDGDHLRLGSVRTGRKVAGARTANSPASMGRMRSEHAAPRARRSATQTDNLDALPTLEALDEPQASRRRRYVRCADRGSLPLSDTGTQRSSASTGPGCAKSDCCLRSPRSGS